MAKIVGATLGSPENCRGMIRLCNEILRNEKVSALQLARWGRGRGMGFAARNVNRGDSVSHPPELNFGFHIVCEGSRDLCVTVFKKPRCPQIYSVYSVVNT